MSTEETSIGEILKSISEALKNNLMLIDIKMLQNNFYIVHPLEGTLYIILILLMSPIKN